MNSLYRIMDANVNRAREGLRVCEDLLRFALNDKTLTHSLKRNRHELTQILLALPGKGQILPMSRDSRKDVGKKSYIRNKSNIGLKSILISNFKRTEESLRVLEECSKLIAHKLIPKFQSLRFRIYELEKKAITRF